MREENGSFRDYLRDHPHVAGEYGRLKRQLAGQFMAGHRDSQEAYARAKTDFIEGIVALALRRGYPGEFAVEQVDSESEEPCRGH